MKQDLHSECSTLAKEALGLLQSNKLGELSTALRKIELAARLTNDEKLLTWCALHFGELSSKLPKLSGDLDKEYLDKLVKALKRLDFTYTAEEVNARLGESGGGFSSIEFVEHELIRFNKEKLGNDGTLYRYNLEKTLSTCANAAYSHATRIYKSYSFGDIPSSQFDAIRNQVDDLLLDICPEAIEQFMSAYERLGSESKEDWSLALTATRRVIKSVADVIYPPRTTTVGGKKLGEEQYINRLWAFLDENMAKGSDKDMGKAHVDYLGSFLERLNQKASKGVHATVTYQEAIRAVLYTYLTLGDILEFAPIGVSNALKDAGKLNINTASLKELSAVKGLNGKHAKEIIKIRVKSPFISIDELSKISGIGPKTIEIIRAECIALP